MDLVDKFVNLSIRCGSTLESLAKEPESLRCVLWVFQATTAKAENPTKVEAEVFLSQAASWLDCSAQKLIEAAQKIRPTCSAKVNLKNLTERVQKNLIEIKEQKRQWALNREKELASGRIDLSKDDYWMSVALEEAKIAVGNQEVPVGAVIVSPDGKIVAKAHNQVISQKDPTAHAEIVAIRKACQAVNNYRLENCSIYVTMEPCPMCSGAIMGARFSRLIYGTKDEKGGAVDSVTKLFEEKRFNHHTVVRSEVRSQECLNQLKDFFSNLRMSKENSGA